MCLYSSQSQFYVCKQSFYVDVDKKNRRWSCIGWFVILICYHVDVIERNIKKKYEKNKNKLTHIKKIIWKFKIYTKNKQKKYNFEKNLWLVSEYQKFYRPIVHK